MKSVEEVIAEAIHDKEAGNWDCVSHFDATAKHVIQALSQAGYRIVPVEKNSPYSTPMTAEVDDSLDGVVIETEWMRQHGVRWVGSETHDMGVTWRDTYRGPAGSSKRF